MNKQVADLSETPIPFHPEAPWSENMLKSDNDKKRERHGQILQLLDALHYNSLYAIMCNNINKLCIDDGEKNNTKCDIVTVFNENIQGVAGESSPIASTSAVKSPLVQRVSGVKRPHSPELEDISKNENRKVKRTCELYCFETLDEVKISKVDKAPHWNGYVEQYGEDFLKHFLQREEILDSMQTPSGESWTHVVNWIIKINGEHGNPDVVHTALWIFFRISAITGVECNLTLVVAACYWLSKKLHSGYTSVKSMVEKFDNVFSKKDLVTIEKRVWKRLDFPAYSTLPQELISYMSYVYDGSGEVLAAATIFQMASYVIYKTYIRLYPSVAAVAAVCNALLVLDRKDLLQKLEIDIIYKEAKIKTHSLPLISAIQREAIRVISSPGYEYDALLQQSDASTVEKLVDSARCLKDDDEEMFQEAFLLLSNC